MNWDRERAEMVRTQVAARGIFDPRILVAFQSVPRHLFIPENVRRKAYEDRALPIGFGQTISQPYMVAITLRALGLSGQEKVLEIGTGSGYQAALLSHLSREVHTIEIVPELAVLAKERLVSYPHVTVYEQDGAAGLPEAVPFDAIVVAAATPQVPEAWLSQLREGGRLVVPVGTGPREILTRIQVTKNGVEEKTFGECSFVPLTGSAGGN